MSAVGGCGVCEAVASVRLCSCDGSFRATAATSWGRSCSSAWSRPSIPVKKCPWWPHRERLCPGGIVLPPKHARRVRAAAGLQRGLMLRARLRRYHCDAILSAAGPGPILGGGSDYVGDSSERGSLGSDGQFERRRDSKPRIGRVDHRLLGGGAQRMRTPSTELDRTAPVAAR